MARAAWIALSVALAALVVGLAAAALVIGTGGTSESVPAPAPVDSGAPRQLELPLARDPRALMLAQRSGKILVGLAVRLGGPLEVAAVEGEEAITNDDLTLVINGKPTGTTVACGHACWRWPVGILEAFPRTIFVAVRGRATFRFRLPGRLPPSGARLFREVTRTMGSLESYRYEERLTSGVGRGQTATFEVRAPDRLRFRTADGFRSVIVGRSRWDYRDGAWERTPFPGLRVPSYMWDGARNARLLGRARIGGRPVQILSVYDRNPVPAWFRLFVAPEGRVLEAEMFAPSHFMYHRYSGFNSSISIEPPA